MTLKKNIGKLSITFFINIAILNLVIVGQSQLAALLLMIWMFFAIGPGSVFGNMAFGEPNAGYDQWLLGMPSIWAWQIIWWALGVGVVWFLANKLRMSVEPKIEIKAISSD